MSSNDTINEIDFKKLCMIFDLNRPPEERKQLDSLFLTYRKLPKIGPYLLTIACNKDGSISNDISLGAAIQLKNYINSYWKYGEDKEMNANLCFEKEDIIIVISNEDKEFIRKNILEGIIYIVEKENVKILKQLSQSVKKILKLDFKNIWKNDFMQCVINCINSQNQKQIYAGIILFYQLSKIYEFEDEENQSIYGECFKLVNEKFIYFIDMCKGFKNDVEALILFKLYKMYFKNFQGDVPSYILTSDTYKTWSHFLVQILKTPLDKQYIGNEKSIYWKLKNICFKIITRVIQKYKSRVSKNKEHNNFRQILYTDFIPQYYDMFTVIYTNFNNNQEYIDDFGKYCVYGFYYYLLENETYKQKIIKLFCENDLLLEEIIKDCTMTKSDLEAWVDSPKEYIGQKEEEISIFETKKFRALKLITSFLEYKDKKTKKLILFDRIYNFLCKVLINMEQQVSQEENKIKNQYLLNTNKEVYLKNPLNIPFCLKKESILNILKKNYETIEKHTDTDALIQKLILPGLQSPCGILREGSCHFISKFKIKNNDLLQQIIKILCFLMEKDNSLQVRVYACIALGNSFECEIAKNLMKGNIKTILEISLKLMEETDVEQIMDNLQHIVKNFTEESQQYIIELSDYLIKYFQRIVEREKNMDEDNKYLDTFNVKSNIVSTFISFIRCFINNPEIYSKITNYIDILIQYFLTSEAPEEGMDLIEEILKLSSNLKTTPNHCMHVYKFYIPLIETVIGTEAELAEFRKNFKNQVFTGAGYESVFDVAKIVCKYIANDPKTFINMKDKNGVAYIVYATKLIESIIQIAESNSEYEEAKYCLCVIMTLFDCFKGQMDKLMTDLIGFVSIKINPKNKITDTNLIQFLLNLISTCFIYDPIKCLNILQNENITKDIFVFWFSNISKISTKIYLKYNLIAICSIIKIDLSQQNKLIINNMKQLIESIFLLTKKINDKIENELNYEENEEYEDDINDDEKEKNLEKDDNKISEQVKNIISGEPTDLNINDNNDEEYSYDELDEEDETLTEFDRVNEILFVKNTLNDIGKNPEMNKIIVESLGDKFKILNDIFNKEEQRIIEKKNKNNKKQ